MEEEFLGDSLIFIISQPRAGSTLLQRILAGHPLIQTSAEPWLMLHPIYALRDTGYQAEYDSYWAYRALHDFLTYQANGETTYLQAIRAWAHVLYGRALQGTGKKFFLDKTPRYYLIIPELYSLFPKAKFIFLIRNPLAVLSSIISVWVKSNWPDLASYRHDLLLAPRHILEGIELLGHNAITIRYEDLVTDPVESVSSLCQRLDISFSEDMLYYGDRPTLKGYLGDPTGIHEHKMPSANSLNKWTHLADTAQTKHLALAYLGELGAAMVEKLGYSASEIKHTLEHVETASSAALVPWHTAIRPPRSRSRKEWLVIRKAMSVQREGPLRGTVSFIKDNFFPLLRSLLPV